MIPDRFFTPSRFSPMSRPLFLISAFEFFYPLLCARIGLFLFGASSPKWSGAKPFTYEALNSACTASRVQIVLQEMMTPGDTETALQPGLAHTSRRPLWPDCRVVGPRRLILQQAYAEHPECFVQGQPLPAQPPGASLDQPAGFANIFGRT